MILHCGSGLLDTGDIFISQDLQSAALSGDYRADGGDDVGGCNEYQSRLTRSINQAAERASAKGQQGGDASGQTLFTGEHGRVKRLA